MERNSSDRKEKMRLRMGGEVGVTGSVVADLKKEK